MTRIPTAPAAAWIDPDIEPAPRATKVLLLTAGGVAVLGHWGDDCVAWAPLPKVPAAIKERLRAIWFRNANVRANRPVEAEGRNGSGLSE